MAGAKNLLQMTIRDDNIPRAFQHVVEEKSDNSNPCVRANIVDLLNDNKVILATCEIKKRCRGWFTNIISKDY